MFTDILEGDPEPLDGLPAFDKVDFDAEEFNPFGG